MKVGEKPFLSREKFLTLFDKLEALGFEKKPVTEILEDVKKVKTALSWLAKRKKEGIETCYRRIVRNCEVVVLTTYSEKLSAPKEHDSGWVVVRNVITNTVLFSFEIRRTLHFIDRLLAVSIAHVEVARKWPDCQFCKTNMGVMYTQDNKMHEREFTCVTKACIGYFEPTGIFLTELPLEGDNKKIFLEPYIRFEKYDYSNKRKGKRVQSRRKKRYYQKHGITEAPSKRLLDRPHDDSTEYHDGDHLQ